VCVEADIPRGIAAKSHDELPVQDDEPLLHSFLDKVTDIVNQKTSEIMTEVNGMFADLRIEFSASLGGDADGAVPVWPLLPLPLRSDKPKPSNTRDENRSRLGRAGANLPPVTQVKSHVAAKKKPVTIGTAKGNRLRCAPSAPKKRHIFVSKLDPSTTENEVCDSVSKATGLEIKCVKLQARFNTYASFRIEVGVEDFDKLLDPDVWDEGILVKPFFGRLTHGANPVHSENSQQGK